MERHERLKWNRRKLGMTQEELAKKVGVSKRTISVLETDETAWTTIRATTEDAIYNTLRKLGSWISNMDGVFTDSPSEEAIDDIKKKLREKRLSLGMSQKKLAELIGIDHTTLCHYENHDKYWKSNNSIVVGKLVAFIEGKYDVSESDDNTSNLCVAVGPNVDGIIVKNDINEMFSVLDKASTEPDLEPVEDTLNNLIDILQDRMKKAAGAGKKTNVYVHMIAGLCEEYLRGVE